MNSRSLKEFENVEIKNKKCLLSFQINTITLDLNSKLEETESTLNILDNLGNKTAEILSRPNNPELEMDFRATCLSYQNYFSVYDPLLTQAWQDYLNAYQQKASLYNLKRDNDRTNLIIYNTETESQEEIKILQTPKSLDDGTRITQLPNGKLFCYGSRYPKTSGHAVLIGMNYGVEVLPSGPPCFCSSCIYFNNSVYCFGGVNRKYLTLSSRFDFDQNRWIQLTPMPKADSSCNSIIYNGNILISGSNNKNLLLYSIDIDSFSTIPYEFAALTRKILINAERLYLIECDMGSVYESEIGSEMNWRRIKQSIISDYPDQLYCSYNKGGIYIGIYGNEYFKFDLSKKRLIKL
ncbi:unnamed protein product [Blepharisma stoltei]|uniref:Kelch motif family protein n=1 Tax=Blepharisma stoltei TaxID=1481888 RepID=A0AAU9JPJ2_9CILI|nr:unnamed protein product [Blepharisma stoltei]